MIEPPPAEATASSLLLTVTELGELLGTNGSGAEGRKEEAREAAPPTTGGAVAPNVVEEGV